MEKHNNYKQNGGVNLEEFRIEKSPTFNEGNYTKYGEELQKARLDKLLELDTSKETDSTITMSNYNFDSNLFNEPLEKLYGELRGVNNTNIGKRIYAKCYNGEIRYLGTLVNSEVDYEKIIAIRKELVDQANTDDGVGYFLQSTYLKRKQPNQPYEVNPFHIKYFLVDNKKKGGNAKKSKRVKKTSRRRRHRSSKRR